MLLVGHGALREEAAVWRKPAMLSSSPNFAVI
jgi:hypothetical protein